MDRPSRSIIISLLALLGLVILALVISALLPFNVDQTGMIQNVTGGIEFRSSGELPVTLDPDSGPFTLAPGERVDVPVGGTAEVLFWETGRIVLTGPATLKIIEAYRRATLPGHALDTNRFEADYGLVLEQSGSARYLFGNTDPPFEDLDITILFPEGSYRPTAPCWTVETASDGTTTARPITCRF